MKNAEKHFSSAKFQYAWGVSCGPGTFFIINFGPPRLEIREPVQGAKVPALMRRRVIPVGRWQLFVWADKWELIDNNHNPICDSENDAEKIASIDGALLEQFFINDENKETRLVFDSKETLIIRNNGEDCIWYMMLPSNRRISFSENGYEYKSI